MIITSKKSLFLIIALVLVSFVSGVIFFPTISTEIKKVELKNTFNHIQQLADEEKEQEIYNTYYSDELKSQISFDELQQRRRSQFNKKPTSNTWEIDNIEISENNGTVYSTNNYCFKDHCDESDNEVLISKTRFTRSKNKWLYSANQDQCDRVAPFEMPEEFSRSLSLIIQRFSESERAEDREFGRLFKSIRNCVDIKYADTQSDIPGSDAIFYFSNNSPTDHLSILVSPKFKSQDDLITASVLTHELYHALLRSDGSDLFIPCLQNEAQAFIIGYNYYYMLNQEEKASFNSRLYTLSSPEVANYFLQNQAILDTPGKDLVEQFSNYVKNNPDYVKQCDENSV